MNKRQAKKWRKKHHFITIRIPYPCFLYPPANMRPFSPDIMLGVEMTFKLKTNPYKPPKLYKDNDNEQETS